MANTSLDTFYGYLFDRSPISYKNDKNELITVMSYFSNPVTYLFKESYKLTPLYKYELVFNNSIGYTDSEIYNEVSSDYTKLYADLFYGIVKIKTDGVWTANENIVDLNYGETENTPIADRIRRKFSDIKYEDGYFEFVYSPDSSSKISKKYVIYYKLTAFEQNYSLAEQYYVFYDDAETLISIQNGEYPDGCTSNILDGQFRERNTIEAVDVYGVLQKFAKDLGKANIYTGVTCYHYNGSTCYYDSEGNEKYRPIHQDFFVFYTRVAPDEKAMRNIIQNQLIIDKGSRDLAAFAYPDLFVNEIRRIFVLEENRGIPISYNKITSFLSTMSKFENPEILTVLQLTCPVIVENGVSDVIEAYSPIEINEPSTPSQIEANRFLFYLSSIINYFNGTNLNPGFLEQTSFELGLDTEYNRRYAQFRFAFVTWRVYEPLNSNNY